MPHKSFSAFAIADSMLPANCIVLKQAITANQAGKLIKKAIPAINPSHAATIQAARVRYGFDVTVPESAPVVSLDHGDSVIVMSVRGLQRLDATRHEYTQDEIALAKFVFSIYHVINST